MEIVGVRVNEDKQGLTWRVTLANYNMDPEKLWDGARGKQLSLALRFGHVDLTGERKPMPVDVGVYSMDIKQDRLVAATASDRTTNATLGDIRRGHQGRRGRDQAPRRRLGVRRAAGRHQDGVVHRAVRGPDRQEVAAYIVASHELAATGCAAGSRRPLTVRRKAPANGPTGALPLRGKSSGSWGLRPRRGSAAVARRMK